MSTSFALSIFLASAQLFFVQPMFARRLLPILGGASSVWTTCMLFYQVLLLGGYLYAHVLSSRLPLRTQLMVHLVLLTTPFFVFAAGPPVWAPPDSNHAVQWLLTYLLAAVGLPFFLLSANSPLVQRWFACCAGAKAKSAYFLYSASNLGSMIALFAYPSILEPRLTLSAQYSLLWAMYSLFALVMVRVIFRTWKEGIDETSVSASHTAQLNSQLPEPARSEAIPSQSDESATAEPTVTLAPNNATTSKFPNSIALQRAKWIFLAFIPSSLLLSVTNYLTSNIAPCPLFWVIPLGLYLLTFVIVFSPWRLVNLKWLLQLQAILLVILATVFYWAKVEFSFNFMFPLHLVTFFVTALMCHQILADGRPKTERLTEFYLCLSIGGALGGLFNALIAPAIFNALYEYPAVLALSSLVRTTQEDGGEKRNWRYGAAVYAVCLALVVGMLVWSETWTAGWLSYQSIVILIPLAFVALGVSRDSLFMSFCVCTMFLIGGSTFRVDTLFRARNTYGALTVVNLADQTHLLSHGNTIHGAEKMDAPRPHEPLTYYHFDSPFGHLFSALSPQLDNAEIGVVGLGCGTMAAYARPGQKWTFYEINPLIVDVAKNPKLYQYLTDCRAPYDVVLGDGRQSLAKARDGQFKLLMFDAFSSDAIPVHLLTREAIRLYLTKLRPDGIMAFHISSRSIDLKPTLRELAKDANLPCLFELSGQNSDWTADRKLSSVLLVMAKREQDIAPLEKFANFKPPESKPRASLWTDDFSNLLETLRLQ
jgi:hypothetical protein